MTDNKEQQQPLAFPLIPSGDADKNLDIVANAEHVLAACNMEHDPDECIYDRPYDLLDDILWSLPRTAVAGLRAADAQIAHWAKEQSLHYEILSAIANGINSDLRGEPDEAATKAETKPRSLKLNEAIDALAREVAEILGPSPQAEAFARRWICYAIEEGDA